MSCATPSQPGVALGLKWPMAVSYALRTSMITCDARAEERLVFYGGQEEGRRTHVEGKGWRRG
jgi:hypothetical protein